MPIPPERFGQDLSDEELQAARDLQQRLGCGPDRCPSPDLLRADAEGVLPAETSEQIRAHLRVCPICGQLHKDLQELNPVGPTEAQLQRMRAAIPQPPPRSRSIGFFRWMLPAVAIASAAMIVIWFAVLPRRGRPSTPATTQSSAAVGRPPAVQIAKAPIEIPAAMLPMRGATDSALPSLEEWTRALQPYRENNFTQAVDRIGEVAKKYPEFADAYFYLGISELLLHKNSDAAATLARAESLESGSHKLAAEWYLGAAYAALGENDKARTAWKQVCGSSSEYAQPACAAIQRLQ